MMDLLIIMVVSVLLVIESVPMGFDHELSDGTEVIEVSVLCLFRVSIRTSFYTHKQQAIMVKSQGYKVAAGQAIFLFCVHALQTLPQDACIAICRTVVIQQAVIDGGHLLLGP
jgi:hypothetical protein